MNCKPDDVVAADDELVLRAATIFSARSARVEDVLTIALRKAEWGGSWGKSGQTISGSSLLRDTKRVRGDDQTRRNETSNKYPNNTAFQLPMEQVCSRGRSNVDTLGGRHLHTAT